jgi:hypothetical protein
MLPLLPRLPIGAELHLHVDACGTPFVGDLPTVASNIGTLRVMLDTIKLTAVGEIIQSLTLPYARELTLISSRYSPPQLWHHAHFQRFAARSSLKDRLDALELKGITNTDGELLQCLLELPLLQRLSLSDSLR